MGNLSNLSECLKAVRNQLLADGVFNDSTCYISITPDLNTYPASYQLAVITPGSVIVNDGWVTGGGDDAMLCSAQIIVTLWSSYAVDRVEQHGAFLTDPSNGAITKIQCIIASLQLLFPKQDNGDWVFVVPLKLQSVERFKPARQKVGWGSTALIFDAEFLQRTSCN